MSNPTPTPEEEKFTLPADIYDKLKFSNMVLIPALSTLYFGLGAAWHLPNVESVIGTLAAIGTFLGVILARASRNSKAAVESTTGSGSIAVVPQQDGSKPMLSIDLDELPDNIESLKAVHLTVVPPK